jgi:hypothetical protein
MAIGLGIKKKVVKPIGKKLKKAEKVGMKTGKALDVGGRKVGNVARKAENVLGVAERNLTGVPVVGDLATGGRQLSTTSRSRCFKGKNWWSKIRTSK